MNYLLHSILREDTIVVFLITVGLVVVGVGVLVVEVVTRISVVLIFGTFYITSVI